MSSRHGIYAFTVACAVLMVGDGRLRAQAQEVRGIWIGGIPQFKIPAARAVPVLEIHELLGEAVETRHFRHEMPLCKFLNLLHDVIPDKGKQIGFVIDMEAFFESLVEGVDVRQASVTAPRVPKTLSVATLLYLIASQLPVDAAIHVRRGYVWITTPEKASEALKAKVGPRVVHGSLGEILDDLAEDTGVNIVLDARVQKQAQRVVEAKFVKPIRLGAALHVLTDMAELTYVLVGDAFYITSPKSAGNLKHEQRAKPARTADVDSGQLIPARVEGSPAKVLDQLAAGASTNIVIDARVKKQCELGVNAKFVRSIRLSTALAILTDMAGLRYLDVDDAAYVTSPANARELLEALRRNGLADEKRCDPLPPGRAYQSVQEK